MAPNGYPTATKKAEAIHRSLQQGKDCVEDVKDFLSMGTTIPEQLVIATFGNRQMEIAPSPKSLKLLLEAKANPKCIDPTMHTPCIHNACWNSNKEVIKLLLEHKADIEAKEQRMKTPPLNTALAAGNAPVALQLLEMNADVTWKHEDGATALHVATAWIASAHNNNLRLPPVGEEPKELIRMMLQNGLDALQTEGMSKGASRSEGMRPLEVFRREIAKSPWRQHPEVGPKFDKMAQGIHKLLEQAESALKTKNVGNDALKEQRFEDAVKQYQEARKVWDKAGIAGHHMAVLWSNEANALKRLKDFEAAEKAAQEGLKLYAKPAIKEKLQHHLSEACEAKAKPAPEPTPEEVQKKEQQSEARKEKAQKQKEEYKEIAKEAVQAKPGGIYGEAGSGQKNYVVPPPYICPMDQAYAMGLGPPPPPKPWWEQKEADSDEEPPRTGITYLPAHHPLA
eukprot:TRINITY_DN39202_c0_g1_i1.p1 TRINITY_DN39202_c0_g1~~TRINITY_DN39202_c0_g1_i1.p1  ORF type:complete len:453 (+),score=136.53 TRINITY_DN39202_c0_g1_i1:116-1474(+)